MKYISKATTYEGGFLISDINDWLNSQHQKEILPEWVPFDHIYLCGIDYTIKCSDLKK